MKKTLFTIIITLSLISSVLVANVEMNKSHKGLTGTDGAKVNCAYCHKKSEIKKEKGQDQEKLKKGPSCTLKDCHPAVDKK